jgi:FKBP-type peptidyl-prolyl cis-trans isomerase FkpA
MKKLFFFALLLITINFVSAQSPTKSKTTTKTIKPAAPEITLKSLADSAGYALGVNIATSLKMQDMTKINTSLITKAINDVLNGKPTLIDDNSAFLILNSYSNKMQEEKNKSVISAGKLFLEKNKLRPEVKTTSSGLQYEIIKEGTGNKPIVADTFVCHYRGTLIDGTEFESSYRRNQPLIMGVSQVIPGWTEGLQLMGVGSKYKFYIPYNLAYGLHGNPPVIPGGAALIFEIELLDVKKKQ